MLAPALAVALLIVVVLLLVELGPIIPTIELRKFPDDYFDDED